MDPCFDQSTLIAIGIIAGLPVAATCFFAMLCLNYKNFDRSGRAWILVVLSVAIGCTALAIFVDQPHCEFRALILSEGAH